MKFEADAAGPMIYHLIHLPFSASQLFDDNAKKCLRAIDNQQLDRLVQPAIDRLRQDLRLPDHELVTFAPHGLIENRHLKLAASHESKRFRAAGLLHTNRHIR